VTTANAGTVVIGGGIVGLAAAYKLLLARPGAPVTVLEKESGVGRHQSGHNSGVLHAGLSYTPGSFKARLAVDGIRQMVSFCEAEGIPHDRCGKLVVATEPTEIPRLRAVMERGQANGLRGLTWLDGRALNDIEPNVRGLSALHVPEEGIVDYSLVCAALARRIQALGGTVVTGAEVQSLREIDGGWMVVCGTGEFRSTYLVNCAGLQCDRIARMAGAEPEVRIVPFRGDYYTLTPERRQLVRHLIYPVPDPAFPFLGVHLTRRMDGRVDAGPNAVLALSRESYTKGAVRSADAKEALGYVGLWRFAARHPAMCWAELRRSQSRRVFAAALRRLVPDIAADDLRPGGCGVRAQAMHRNGSLVEDFLFVDRPKSLHLLNAPSPGATASLAIGDVIVARMAKAA
jgi:(S)-2-hydroxyglutarate dehydrogenase